MHNDKKNGALATYKSYNTIGTTISHIHTIELRVLYSPCPTVLEVPFLAYISYYETRIRYGTFRSYKLLFNGFTFDYSELVEVLSRKAF